MPASVALYTDGSALGNPGRGGWAALLVCGELRKELVGAYQHTTNNRMELMAVICGLEALRQEGLDVALYTDSTYVVHALERKWLQKWIATGFRGKQNADLWLRLWSVYQRHRVAAHWVEGHAGHVENEYCDRLAVTAAKGGPWLRDTGYEERLLAAPTCSPPHDPSL